MNKEKNQIITQKLCVENDEIYRWREGKNVCVRIIHGTKMMQLKYIFYM